MLHARFNGVMKHKCNGSSVLHWLYRYSQSMRLYRWR